MCICNIPQMRLADRYFIYNVVLQKISKKKMMFVGELKCKLCKTKRIVPLRKNTSFTVDGIIGDKDGKGLD